MGVGVHGECKFMNSEGMNGWWFGIRGNLCMSNGQGLQ